jgi:hypothetical protein
MELILMQASMAAALLLAHFVAVVRDRIERTNRVSGTGLRIVEWPSHPPQPEAPLSAFSG